jgi:hypothetical protein
MDIWLGEVQERDHSSLSSQNNPFFRETSVVSIFQEDSSLETFSAPLGVRAKILFCGKVIGLRLWRLVRALHFY